MNDTIVLAGKVAKLVCNVVHDNDAHLNIKWLKDKEIISSLNEKLLASISLQQVSRNEYQTEASLTINNVTKSNAGEYTCLVETEVDYDQSSSNVKVSKVKKKENFVVVYISVSICLIIGIVTYLTYPYCITKTQKK